MNRDWFFIISTVVFYFLGFMTGKSSKSSVRVKEDGGIIMQNLCVLCKHFINGGAECYTCHKCSEWELITDEERFKKSLMYKKILDLKEIEND